MYLLSKLSNVVRRIRMIILHIKGYKHIDDSVIIESNVGLDVINPTGIYIGANTLVGSHTIILAHEHIFRKPDGGYYVKDTHIGRNCFIGVRSLICPGVHIGDQCVVGGVVL